MKNQILKSILALAFVLASGTSAFATTFTWNWTPGTHPAGADPVNNFGGTLDSITAVYDDVAQTMQWSVTLGDRPIVNVPDTAGYTLVISGGEIPRDNDHGKYAILYFDGSDRANPVLTGYTYNGENALNSHEDSLAEGLVAPEETIFTSLNDTAGVVNSLNVTQTANDVTFDFDINVAPVNSFVPLTANPSGDPFAGLEFGPEIGVWLHPFTLAQDIDYSTGFVDNFVLDQFGSIDVGFQPTSFVPDVFPDTPNDEPVPEPSSLILLGLASAGFIKKKRS